MLMRLVSLLDAQTIYIEHHETTLVRVYAKLVEKICQHHNLPECCNHLMDLILKREAEGSTTYPSGIAIPHVRLDNLDDTIIGMCVLKKPVVIGDISLKMVILIITDKSSSKLYLNLVATLLKLSRNPAQMSLLMTDNTAHDVIGSFRMMDLVVKEDLTIGDIMTQEPLFVRPESKLSEMGRLMAEHGISVFPVVDEKMRFLGEASVLNYLKVGIPEYLLLMDNLQFLRAFEPLERLIEKETDIQVREIMQNADIVLSPETSIIETVFEMIQHKKRFFSVVQDGKLVGVITAMDIYRRVIRA
ncbi:MAG: CBS domain-containing protein [Candidatus Cloacimonetes bacterium]|nr:CBS domain-containing protein [Candidatus Cloacimonadota bacterium]